jgi:hypothetical protein
LKIADSQLPLDIQEWRTKELSRSEFPTLSVLISTMGLGPSVTCLLQNKNGFGVSGHATRTTLKASIDAALAEACRAAHATLRKEYWGDSLRLKQKLSGSVDPGAHSVYYAYHEPFPAWMTGEAMTWAEAARQWDAQMDGINESDFRFQTVLETPLFVGFARHSMAFDLHWGSTDLAVVLASPAMKRLNVKFINTETHIVS